MRFVDFFPRWRYHELHAKVRGAKQQCTQNVDEDMRYNVQPLDERSVSFVHWDHATISLVFYFQDDQCHHISK
jgi:hypothetical protein